MDLLNIQDLACITILGFALLVLAVWAHYHKPPSGKW